MPRSNEQQPSIHANSQQNEHRHHSLGEAAVPRYRSKPTIHRSGRQLQHPRLPPFLLHHRRLRRRWLPLRDKAGPQRAVDGDRWIDRVDGWVYVRLPELRGSAHGLFP